MKSKARHNLKVIVSAITFFLLTKGELYAQQTDWWSNQLNHEFEFVNHPQKMGGFDKPSYPEWNEQFKPVEINDTSLIAPIQSIYSRKRDWSRLIASVSFDPNELKFYYNDSLVNWNRFISKDTIDIEIPSLGSDGVFEARIENRTVAVLKLRVYKQLIEHLVIIGLNDFKVEDSLITLLKRTFSQAGIDIVISNQAIFQDTVYTKDFVFSNPLSDHVGYTREMRQLRDRFFDAYPSSDKSSYYLFVVHSFKNPKLEAYAAKNKAMLFVTQSALSSSSVSIPRELARSIGMLENSWEDFGPKKGTTSNLMDTLGGHTLNALQWSRLRHSSRSYSFYDTDEEILTNNGMVAYYLWEEDEDGNILITDNDPLKSLIRPFKKNYFSYHLNVQDQLFEVAYSIGNLKILWWHIILWGAISIVFISMRIRQFKKWRSSNMSKRLRSVYSLIFLSSFATVYIGSFYLINFELQAFEVTQGRVPEFDRMSSDEIRSTVLYNTELRTKQQTNLNTEILIRKGAHWYLKKRKAVLYFDATLNDNGEIKSMRFNRDSDTLNYEKLGVNEKVETHYFVINYYFNKQKVKEQLFNHLGFEMTELFNAPDQAKRVLLFVNGYRPTSTGHSFEENFEDVLKRGFEYPQTSNMIFTFDRYDYWQPWQAIDEKFKERINPQETYYADGHFSVSTSNYKSLFNFTKISSIYPKRCKDPSHHTCNELKVNTQNLFGNGVSPTISLLPINKNHDGFDTRVQNGKIAGKNLLSILDEIPGNASNDTIFIVSHSMGFAYASGIIEELRGKVNFGGFVIIAPENAASGGVNPSEWQYIWQFGSKLDKNTPACLQDGIAPQSCVSGLNENYRSYFPTKDWYSKQGFFNSHFVGYYTWIFDIDKNQVGYIPQR